MAVAIRVYTKKMRAPEAGTMIGIRLQEPQLKALEAWIDRQPKPLSRPEAIRQLIGKALCEPLEG